MPPDPLPWWCPEYCALREADVAWNYVHRRWPGEGALSALVRAMGVVPPSPEEEVVNRRLLGTITWYKIAVHLWNGGREVFMKTQHSGDDFSADVGGGTP